MLLRGLSPLVATICTPLAAPVIAATRLRGGNAGSARGAAGLVAEAIGVARSCGATGLSEVPARHGGPLTPASLHRIRATLRAALNAAIHQGVLRDNPARHVELPTPRRPPAQVWTKARVDAWRARGERSTVAVWTEHQLAEFLGFVEGPAQAGTRTAEGVPATQAEKPASHPQDTHATPTVHTRQSRAMNAQVNGCAARDSNPEPAD